MAPRHRSVESARTPAAGTGRRNLESALECSINNIVIDEPAAQKLPIAVFDVADTLGCGLALKNHSVHFHRELSGALHASHQDFASISPQTPGKLFLLDSITHNRSNDTPISVFGLTIEEDVRVRWFWTIKKSSVALKQLDKDGLIKNCIVFEPGSATHRKLLTTSTMLFQHHIYAPQAADYERARAMTDWSCEIDDPDNAWNNVMSVPYIYYNAKEPFMNMSDDRYLLELEPAKRLLASIVHVSAAKYLLIKRQYFKAFFRDMTIHRDQIPVPAQVASGQQAAEGEAQRRRDEHITAAQRGERHAGSGVPEGVTTGPAAREQDRAASDSTKRSLIVVLKYGQARAAAVAEILSSQLSRAPETPCTNAASPAPPETPCPMTSKDDTPVLSAPTRSLRAHQNLNGAELARRHAKDDEDATTLASDVPSPKRRKAMQVRSDKAHIDSIKTLTNMSWSNARMLQEGWKAMGLLNEENYVCWIDAGGMFETIGLE